MRLPSFNQLFPDQREVYDVDPDTSMLVVGPPGSGKTSMAIWRAKFLVSPELNRRVMMVTRNRLLTSVATQLAREAQGSNIGAVTMSSYLTRDYAAQFPGTRAPQHAPFDYIWGDIEQQYEAAGVRPTLDHLIIDEGQNLPVEFVRWALRFKARAVSIFADEDQSTLDQKWSFKQLLALGFTEVHSLANNHRNTPEIAAVSTFFHTERVLPPAQVVRRSGAPLPRLLPVSSWPALADAISGRLLNRAESIGVILYKKADVEKVYSLLKERLAEQRVDFYISDQGPGAESAIKMRDNGVTVICSESAIGLEFDTVYLQDLRRSLPVRGVLEARRLYTLCARARDMLILVNGPQPLAPAQLTALPPVHMLER